MVQRIYLYSYKMLGLCTVSCSWYNVHTSGTVIKKMLCNLKQTDMHHKKQHMRFSYGNELFLVKSMYDYFEIPAF
jgi:hypothetical protein